MEMEYTMGVIDYPTLDPYTPFETKAQYSAAHEAPEFLMDDPFIYEPPKFVYDMYFSKEDYIPAEYGILYKMTREWLKDNADEWGLPEWVWQKPWRYLDEHKMEIFEYGEHSPQRYENRANLIIHGFFNELKYHPENYDLKDIFRQKWLPRAPKDSAKYSLPYYASHMLKYNLQFVLNDMCKQYGMDNWWVQNPRVIIKNYLIKDAIEEIKYGIEEGTYGDMIDDSANTDGWSYYEQEVLQLDGVLV